MASLLLRIVLFVVVLPFLVLWLAAGAIAWGADAILRASRQRERPPFGIARRASDPRFASTVAVFVVLMLVIGAGSGGGESGTEPEPSTAVATSSATRDDDAAKEDAEARARAEQQAADARREREERRAERLERRRVAEERRRARLAAQRRRERREARALREAREQQALLLAQQRELDRELEAAAAAEGEDCHPSYEGACLDPNASDYDCEGGSGDGPEYTGTVTLVGPDEYDLERDDDGIACDVS